MAIDIALEALKQALSLEREGIRFYKEASERVRDAGVQKMFLALAGDEQDHQRMITAQLRSLESGKGWSKFSETENVEPVTGAPTLFPKGKPEIDKAVKPVSC